jgi:hypothetical protein
LQRTRILAHEFDSFQPLIVQSRHIVRAYDDASQLSFGGQSPALVEQQAVDDSYDPVATRRPRRVVAIGQLRSYRDSSVWVKRPFVLRGYMIALLCLRKELSRDDAGVYRVSG